MLEVLVRLQYKRLTLLRKLVGMSGLSGHSYLIVTWFLFMMFFFQIMPILWSIMFGGTFVVIGETALVVVIVSAAIYMIITVFLAPLGILLL